MNYQWFDMERNAAGWDSLAGSTGQSLFNLSPVIAVHRFGKAMRRGVIAANRNTAALVGGLVRPSGGKTVFESLSFPGPDCGLDGESLANMMPWLRSQGIDEVRLGSFDGGLESYALDLPGLQTRERLEFLYDLEQDEESRWSALCTNHRRKLKKAEKIGFRLERIEAKEPLIMARLHVVWSERKGDKRRFRAWWHTFLYYQTLSRWLGKAGIGKLYGLFSPEGEILSVAYMLEKDQRAFYMIGASSSAGYQNGASVALFWQLARRYRDAGIEVLNLGGVPREATAPDHEEHGVYRFKLGFGIAPTLRRSVTLQGNA